MCASVRLGTNEVIASILINICQFSVFLLFVFSWSQTSPLKLSSFLANWLKGLLGEGVEIALQRLTFLLGKY